MLKLHMLYQHDTNSYHLHLAAPDAAEPEAPLTVASTGPDAAPMKPQATEIIT